MGQIWEAVLPRDHMVHNEQQIEMSQALCSSYSFIKNALISPNVDIVD